MAKFKNILLTIISVVFVILIIIAVFSYTKKYNNRKVKEVRLEVISPENKEMISKEYLLEYLNEEITNAIDSNIKLFENQIVTEKLYKLEAVDTVYISCGVTGVLSIDILQKNPIAKVHLSKSEFKFLTDKGELIKSPYYGKKIIEVRGNIKEDTYKLVNFINKDKFLNAITESILIDNNKGHMLTVNYIEQPIRIGEIENLNEKSDNLRYFFEVVTDSDMEKYKELNLNYKNQIIAIK